MENRKRYLIIGICAIIGTIIGVTSAWYTWTSSNTNVTLTIGGITVTYNAGTDITGRNLRPVSTKEVGVTNNYAIKKDITVSSNKTTYFNLYLNAETFGAGLKHESLKWELYEGSALLNSGNFESTVQGDKITLLSNTEINSTTRNLSLYIWIDGNMSNPSSMQNQSYRFVLNADATDKKTTAADYLTNLYNTGTATQETTANDVTYEYRKDISMMTDIGGNLRYYGADPDNYVMFNNEQWRIIGVFNNIDDGTGKLETRVKIAKSEPLSGIYARDDGSASSTSSNYEDVYARPLYNKYEDVQGQFMVVPPPEIDVNGSNNWTNTSLQAYLNGDYLSSITTSSLIGNAIWDIRGSSTASGLYANDYYNLERTTGTAPTSTTEVTWPGKIALMYPSDYMYAGDLMACAKDGYNWSRDTTNCRDKSWLRYTTNNQWTLMPHSGIANLAFSVSSDGSVNNFDVIASIAVRPVLFLNSNVAIVDGSGKPGDEFILE